MIVGVDEAGRGALAGPVVAAAVAFTDLCIPEDYQDSKQLTSQQRAEKYEKLKQHTTHIAIGIVDNHRIDQINILNATMEAMAIAIQKIELPHSEFLIDGNKCPSVSNLSLKSIVKGDQLIPEISAASIVAKVTRDRLMEDYHKHYSSYGFDQHKGYGTKSHYTSIFTYGASPIHRKSFNLNQQETLFT